MDKRYVDLDGTFNFRDMGGYATSDNKHVKYGLLYRSDELCHLSDQDIQRLEEMPLRTIVDYRNEKERQGREDKVIKSAKTYYLDPKADVAAMASKENAELPSYDMKNMSAAKAKAMMIGQNEQFVLADDSAKAYRSLFDIILDINNCPMVHHCRGGKDRTGFGAALILLVLGVSKADVIKDYMLTNYYKKDKNEKSLKELLEQTHNEDLVEAVRYFKEANEEFLLTALDLIDRDYGSPINFVKQRLGLSDEDITTLKEYYTQ